MNARPATTVRRITAFRALWAALRGATRPGAPSLATRTSAVPRLLRAAFTGRYPHLRRGKLALMVLAVVYVIAPVDLMPELVLTVFGLGDDALVMAWLAGTLLAETDAFLDWEAAAGRVVPGEVVRGDRGRGEPHHAA